MASVIHRKYYTHGYLLTDTSPQVTQEIGVCGHQAQGV